MLGYDITVQPHNQGRATPFQHQFPEIPAGAPKNPCGKKRVGADLSDFEVILGERCRKTKKRRLVSGAALLLPNAYALPKGVPRQDATGDYDYAILTLLSLRASERKLSGLKNKSQTLFQSLLWVIEPKVISPT